MAIIKCEKCGGNVSDKAKACPHCGTIINQSQVDIPSDNKTISNPEKASVRKKKQSKVILVTAAIIVSLTSLFIYLGQMSGWTSGYWEDLIGAIKGDAEAQCGLGWHYYFDDDFNTAVKWYRKAAEKGNSRAQVCLGKCYKKGEGVSQDFTEAFKWFSLAAEQDNDDAQVCLGDCYLNGEGVTQDYEKAVKCFRKAATRGFSKALIRLGECYENGTGLNQDYSMAMNYYLEAKSIDNYNPEAEFHIGTCYEQGHGVSIDLEEAVKWYNVAANHDNDDAKAALQRLGYQQ